MSDNNWGVGQRLDRWEQYLESLFNNISTIGEVSIRRDDYEEIKHALRDAIAAYGFTKATRDFKLRWPHAFITYLSFTAAYNTNRGYWDCVVADLGLSSKGRLHSKGTHWGKNFLELTSQFKLEEFPELDSGFKYVTPIRLHGGIPRYSLPDFFEFILMPSVEKPRYAALSDTEALEEILERSSTQILVDNVIALFFENAGHHALQFFFKCRNMAFMVTKGEPLPPPSEIGLRPYVVSLFEVFLQSRKEQETKQRIRSPKLTFLPHQPSFRILFPEVTITENQAYRQHMWRVRLFRNQEQVEENSSLVKPHRKGHEVRLESKEVMIDVPYEQGIIEFCNQPLPEEGENEFHVLKRWQIRFLPDPEQPPVIGFDEQGQPVRYSEGLPAETCWLITPNCTTLDFDGKAKCVAKENYYWKPWDVWKAELWDLHDARLLYIIGEDDKQLGVLPVVQPLPVPVFRGGKKLDHSKPIDDKPLYLGIPPKITIPKEKNQSLDSMDLENWIIEIESLWTSEPKTKEKFSLLDIQSCLVSEEETIDLPLEEIIGKRPIGTFDFTITRPDSEIFNRHFRMWPQLEVNGLKPLYLPDEKGANPAHIQITLPPEARLESREEDLNGEKITLRQIDLNETKRVYSATIPPLVAEGEFHLLYPKPPEPIKVPLSLRIPRLLWTLRFEDMGVQELKWRGEIQYYPLPKIFQSEHSLLYITADLPQAYEVRLYLQLTVPGKETVLQQLEPKVLSEKEPRIHFDIQTFLDTMREFETEPFFDLTLKVVGLDQRQPIKLSCIRLTRNIDIQGLWLQKLAKGNWVLHWRETNPLQHRRVYLWSLWQPWHDPIEIKLPDNAPRSDSIPSDYWWMHELPLESAPLIPGSYALQFVAIPTWEDRPLPGEPPDTSVHIIQTTGPEERLKWIETALKKQPQRAFALHFERACVYENLGKSRDRDAEVSWCSSNLTKGSCQLIAVFYHWLEDKDPFTQKALRMRMYKPPLLEVLFTDGVSQKTRESYLEPFLEVETVNTKSAELILENARNEQYASRALQILSESKSPLAVRYIKNRIDQGRFSDSGGVALLKSHASFAIQELFNLDKSAARNRLLRSLSEYTKEPLLIFAGWWIRCDAGWGKIDRILESRSASEVEYFRIDQDTPFLEVTLRPQKHPIKLFLNLESNQMSFPNDDQLFMCTHSSGCYRFISNDYQEVIGPHTHAAHEGLQPSYRPVDPQSPIRGPMEYRSKPPDNLYL